jgi:hypothetical protein
MALYTFTGALMFFGYYGRNKQGLIKSILVLILSLVVTAPWWGKVVSTHGFSPFLIAASSGAHNTQSIIRLFFFGHTGEEFIQLVGVLGMIGFFWELMKGESFLPALMIALFVVDPRSSGRVVSPIMAILATFTIVQFYRSMISSVNCPMKLQITKKGIISIFFLLMGFQMLVSAISAVQRIPRLQSSELKVCEWTIQETPKYSSFLILSDKQPMSDPLAEWFPALTGRKSIATVQGYEWIENPGLIEKIQSHLDLQTCIDSDISCLKNWKARNNARFDYLIINKTQVNHQNAGDSALAGLLEAKDFKKVYESDDNILYIINN